MKKLIIIYITLFLMCGCTAQDVATTTQAPTESGQTQLNESSPTFTPEPTPEPEPTPVRPIKSVTLPVVVSDNEQFLTRLDGSQGNGFVTEMETPVESLLSPGDDACYVEFNPDRMNNLQLDHPDMPMYRWYINGSYVDKIAQVVIEFDLLETIHPLHAGFFGYDKGYFITLHYDQKIRLDQIDMQVQESGNLEPIKLPELCEDLRKYAVQNGKHITITIPYSEFQGTEKDLTLQFLPGTTFANLSIDLWGADELNETIISEISQKISRPEHDLLSEVLSLLNLPKEAWGFPSNTGDIIAQVGNAIWNDDGLGLVINSDGSINMPVSFYDLGEYADEVQGKYAVIPEGLIPAFATLSSCAYCGNLEGNLELEKQLKSNLVNFVFENLMDETGQFYGVYDIDQGKTVATGRKSPALPILSSMCGSICGMPDTSVISDKEVKLILNSIIANDIIRIGDKLYYDPNGISKDGVMELKLSDLYISDSLLAKLIDYSADESSLDEKYGVALLLEGYLNSLKLVAEGQEQNETRLPSSKLTVIFKDGGNSYELQPSDTFDINDSFFANVGLIGAMSDCFPGQGAPFSKLKFNRTEQSITKQLSAGRDGIFDESQKRVIRECERQYAEYYNMYEIQTTYYECFLYIYNFLQMQPVETAYAPKYNVHTGEMIEAPTEMLYPQFKDSMAPMISRIGTPATLMNYNLLVGVFNDETELVETAKVLASTYGRWMSEDVFRSRGVDGTNPDLYADNGFNIWGYDSLYPMGHCYTTSTSSKPFYDRLGFSFSREDWMEYTMRKLNERARSDEELVSIDDEFPLFYDHLPETMIAD